MTDTMIATEKLTKKFNGATVVDGVSLHVKRGKIYGFVGLNDAGKTTTIRMILGMIRPTNGRAFIMGEHVDAGRHDLWKHVGYMVETPHSYPELTVWQNLEVVWRLRGLSDSRAIDRVMYQLGLARYRAEKAEVLSLDNKQRLGLAKALIHQPTILLLDEPTNGLDPAGIAEVRHLLRDLSTNEGVAILLSSHLLVEVSKLATRLGIIHEGRLVKEIIGNRLHHLLRRRLIVKTRDVNAARATLNGAGYDIQIAGDSLCITERRAVDKPEEVANVLVHADVPPVLLKVEIEDLETYFLRIISERRNALK